MGIQQIEGEDRECPSLVEDWKYWPSAMNIRVQYNSNNPSVLSLFAVHFCFCSVALLPYD